MTPVKVGQDRLVQVELSALRTSHSPNDVLVTYALGSCVALIVHDPVIGGGGMLRYMLPHSRISPEKARRRPAMFGDTGVPLLLEEMKKLGSKPEDLVVKAAGAGKLFADRGTFDIGGRNYAALGQLLAKAGLTMAAEDVGGSRSRSARLYVGSGRVAISSQGVEVEL